MIRALGLLLGLLVSGCVRAPAPDTPQPVASLDVQRYLGTWWEAARLPMWAQDSEKVTCEDTNATYTLRPDGRLGVLNKCLNAREGDAPREAVGEAYAVPGSNNTRLRVSFFWPFYGDYWVLGLDPDYRWAVVGDPARKYLWVLSRTPHMAPADLRRALGIARDAGYDLAPLHLNRGQVG